MATELGFDKYKVRGADYHYRQINKKNIKSFNSFVFARYTKHIQLTIKKIKLLQVQKIKNIKILDVGCGDGVLLYLLKIMIDKEHINNIDIEFFGVDSSEEALVIARQKIDKGNFIKNDVYLLDFSDNTFDIVLSSDVIEHVQYPEQMLAEIKRVSKGGAFVVVGTPIRYTEIPLDDMHVKEFYPSEFMDLMKKYFFNCQLTKSFNLIIYLLCEKQFRIFNKKIQVFRYIFNCLALFFNFNPFLNVKNNIGLFSYMFVESEVNKK